MESLAYLHLIQMNEEGHAELGLQQQPGGIPSFNLSYLSGLSRGVLIAVSGLVAAGTSGADVAMAEDYAVDYAGGGYYYIFDEGDEETKVVVVREIIHSEAAYHPVRPDPVPVHPICTVLKYGDSGEPVRCLQDQLRKAGYFSGPSTGYFGSQTKHAVIAFQQDYGLVVDGIAGPQTLSALNQVLDETGYPG